MEPYQPRVLVLDALHDAADSLAILLTLWGHPADPVYDATAALAAARAQPPRAVVMDVRTAGAWFAEALRELPGCGGIPVLAVAGHPADFHDVRESPAGVNHYLLKPVDPGWFRLFFQGGDRDVPTAPPPLRAGLGAGKGFPSLTGPLTADRHGPVPYLRGTGTRTRAGMPS
ncbi:hypothetical protein J0H58_33155 [bacterium]|nr:hypothetical protein [bacterium]